MKALGLFVDHCEALFLFSSLQRGLTESTYLKRSEAVGPVPSITISIPKPSFATSGTSATVDKTSALNHVTGCCQSCDVATTQRSCSMWTSISKKAFYLLLLWSSSEAELPVSQAVFFRQKHGVSSWKLSLSQFLLSMAQWNSSELNVKYLVSCPALSFVIHHPLEPAKWCVRNSSSDIWSEAFLTYNIEFTLNCVFF